MLELPPKKITLNDGLELEVKWCGASEGVLWIDGIKMDLIDAVNTFSNPDKTARIVAPYDITYDGYIKLINNNYNLLEYETLDNITKTLNMILMSKRPLVGLQLIKDSLINFNYKGVPLFKFLEKISSDHLIKLNTFKSEIDLITRWAYILKALNETDRLEVINNFNLSFKNKVIWLLNNFELIFEDDYKMAIYNARDTLKIITENKFDVFLMYEMFSRLTKLHSALDEDLKDKCKLINDTICCRPFFKYQLMYDDADIKEISQCNLNDHEFENRKETLLKTIIKYNMHPTEEQYKNDIITVFN